MDHRFAALDRFNACSLIADNAIHGAFVLGEAIADWSSQDLAAQPARLLVNGAEVLSGAGDRALGHPLAALAWLANALSAQGRTLRAGDIVTTGLVTDGVHEAVSGDRLLAEFDGIGQVELRFE